MIDSQHIIEESQKVTEQAASPPTGDREAFRWRASDADVMHRADLRQALRDTIGERDATAAALAEAKQTIAALTEEVRSLSERLRIEEDRLSSEQYHVFALEERLAPGVDRLVAQLKEHVNERNVVGVMVTAGMLVAGLDAAK